MVNEQLLEWIISAEKTGHSPEQLKSILIEKGYAEADVDEALRLTQKSNQVAAPPSTEPITEDEQYAPLAIPAIILSFVFYPAGFIFAIITLRKIKKNPRLKGKKLAHLAIFLSNSSSSPS